MSKLRRTKNSGPVTSTQIEGAGGSDNGELLSREERIFQRQLEAAIEMSKKSGGFSSSESDLSQEPKKPLENDKKSSESESSADPKPSENIKNPPEFSSESDSSQELKINDKKRKQPDAFEDHEDEPLKLKPTPSVSGRKAKARRIIDSDSDDSDLDFNNDDSDDEFQCASGGDKKKKKTLKKTDDKKSQSKKLETKKQQQQPEASKKPAKNVKPIHDSSIELETKGKPAESRRNDEKSSKSKKESENIKPQINVKKDTNSSAPTTPLLGASKPKMITMPKWTPPARVTKDSPSNLVTRNNLSPGFRVGLSRNVKGLKPLHPKVKLDQ